MVTVVGLVAWSSDNALCWINEVSSLPDPISTWMGDSLSAGKPSE